MEILGNMAEMGVGSVTTEMGSRVTDKRIQRS
jgi:hypothetical protein